MFNYSWIAGTHLPLPVLPRIPAGPKVSVLTSQSVGLVEHSSFPTLQTLVPPLTREEQVNCGLDEAGDLTAGVSVTLLPVTPRILLPSVPRSLHASVGRRRATPLPHAPTAP